jgi:hypothetical protein
MTILQKPPHSGDGPARKSWYRLGHADHAVRHTDAWEQENFLEEQARWERGDPEYARICDEVRRAPKRGEEASRHADQAKAEWDARVAPRRQANDDAQKAHHVLNAEQTARRHRRRANSVERASAIGDTHARRFAAHVHEVVGLDKRRAPLEAIEARIDSMTVDVEEQSALWLLAWSLRARQTRR